MQVALAGLDSSDNSLLIQAKKNLESHGIRAKYMKDNDFQTAREVDAVIVAGGDRGILNYFHKVVTESAPVIGIYEPHSTGFLAQLEFRELSAAASKLKAQDFGIEQAMRLAVNVDGRDVEPVLNDVAVFPSKSATLMEHLLRIDGNDVWNDKSDGVIISTPAGSTAYSMSAGGPMVLRKSQVFVVVSVNSLDNTRRPLVISNESQVEVTEITSRYHCEVVIDGGVRIRIKNRLKCNLHEFPARFIRLSKDSSATALIAKKVQLSEDLLKMPPSAKLILKTLEYEGPLSQRELALKTMLPERTIRLSLSHLLNEGYVKRKTSLRDARQRIYERKM